MTSNITGTWFPSGFHGYTKLSEARNDINCTYRQLAKPSPPNRFKWRLMQPLSQHPFSLHDNRKILVGDPEYFGKGLGRKQTDKKYHPRENVMIWKFDKTQADSSLPYMSTYKNMFCQDNQNISSQNVFHITKSQTQKQPYGVTTYQFVHGNANPYKEMFKKDQGLLNLHIDASLHRPKTAPAILQESVALCLQWERPCRKTIASTSIASLKDKEGNGTEISKKKGK